MPWSEQWRSADRPTADEIPDKYGISARPTEKLMMGYFTGTTVFAYFAMRYIGTRDQLVAGLPVMMWMIVIVSALVIFGLYVVFTRSGMTEGVTEIGDKAEVNND